jgi:hypothetical protein
MREDSRAGVKLVTLVGAALLLGFAVVDYISVSTLMIIILSFVLGI